jgi:RecA-family ATPase
MSTDLDTVIECARQICPSSLDYEEWLGIGMIMKDAGASVSDFEEFCRRDPARFKNGECERKWKSFRRGHGLGIGTIVKMCRDHGGTPPKNWHSVDGGHELDWNAEIGPSLPETGERKRNDLQIVRAEWLQDAPLPPAPGADWNGVNEFRRYLSALFGSDEKVGYVTEAWQSEADGEGRRKWLPRKGVCDRTAGELLELLSLANGLGDVIGDWEADAGAWIRFNPLDGAGCSDANVTAHRFALVESDSIPIERQHAIYRQLELPCAALVHSGGKSLHAIVRIDAPDFKEYQKRVDFLYDVCKKNGLHIDRNNRNPSRLSRLPGATRGDKKQWLVATNTGKATWQEWAEWIAAVNDDLPDVTQLSDVWDNLPPLAGELIGGLLRTGHKMLLSGPSKAGKSYMLMRLCVAIAEGVDWLGWKCAQGRVLYVNLELDPASALHRLKDLYKAAGIPPANVANIDIWNLRGKAMPMTELAPRLIRRSLKRRYMAIVIDPIYKVITGDENAADQMAKFCNQFDKVCAELKCAVIYCHHHSKGSQGQKRAADRASGSGVFARDPDALLDLIELTMDDARRAAMANRWESEAMADALDRDCLSKEWREDCPQDDAIVAEKMFRWAERSGFADIVRPARAAAVQASRIATAWRVEGTLREFQPFPAKRIFFHHPVHVSDAGGLLEDALAEGEEPPRVSREKANEKRAILKTEDAWSAYAEAKEEAGDMPPTLECVAACMHDSKNGDTGITEQNARKRLKEAGFSIKGKLVFEGSADNQNVND